MRLNDYHLRLLAEGINSRGRIISTFADRIYSSPGKGREALVTLESWGWIKLDLETCGVFIVIKAPPEAFEMAKNLKAAKTKTEKKIDEENAELTDKIGDI